MDKIFEALMKDLGQKAEEAKKETASNHDEVDEMKKHTAMTANLAKMQFDQFVKVGFTEEQATQFVVAILH